MGLDMYLNARRYLSVFTPEECVLSQKISELLGIRSDENPLTGRDHNALRVTEVRLGLCYWRKENAIHQWFVENCAEGKDDCRPVHVEREQLEALKQTCLDVLADNSKAEELLPTQSGFFFGGTDYDEWYFEGLKSTATELEAILNNETLKGFSFEYEASW